MRITTLTHVVFQARTICVAALGLFVLNRFLFGSEANTSKGNPKLPPASTATIDFAKDVQPVLESRCYSCHGPKKQESGLRLDDADLALKGGDMGPAYLPGKSAASHLVLYAAGANENIVMP